MLSILLLSKRTTKSFYCASIDMSDDFGEILLSSSTLKQVIFLESAKVISTPTVALPVQNINTSAPVIPTYIPVLQPPPKAPLSIKPSLSLNQPLLTINPTQPSGKILPTQVYQNPAQPYFIPFSELSTLQVGNISTIVNTVSSFINPVLNASTILCQELDANKISLDNAILTANNTELLLNGVPLATIENLSSIADWSLDPAINDIDVAFYDIKNVKNITAVDFIGNALNVNQAFISDLTVYQQTTENFASTFTIEARDIFCSTISVNDNVFADNGVFSTMTSGTVSSMSTIGSAGYFQNLTATSINGVPYSGSSNWSVNPATSAVNMNQFPLNGGSNFAINSSNLTITGSNQISNVCSDYSVVADESINIASPARINLTAQNGTFGEVNITANGGFNNGINGAVNITANGSQFMGVGQGGSVNITANTPLGFSNLTSKISLNASGINSYAGAIPPIASLAGYQFIYGTGGVNICAGLPPGALPNTVGTTYIYGTTGIEMPSDAYMKNIYPYWDGLTTPPDLNITGRYIAPNFAQVRVNLSNVRSEYFDSNTQALIQDVKTINFYNSGSNAINNLNTLSMVASNGTINNVKLMSMPGGTITGVNSISVNAISNLNTINGAPYPPTIPPTSISPNLSLSTLTFPTTLQSVSSGIYFNNINSRRNWIAETNYTGTQQNLGVFSDAYDTGGTVDTDWLKMRGVRLGYNGVSSFCKFERWGSNGFVLASQSQNNTTTADYITASNANMTLQNVSTIHGDGMFISSFREMKGGTKVGQPDFKRVLEYYYNPPTPQNGVEIAVKGKAQNAGAIITASMGTDLNTGSSYIQSVWDGYISMPLNFYGATFNFQSDNDYCLFIDGQAGAPATLSTSHTFFMASTITQKNVHIVASNRQPFVQYGKVTTTGTSGSNLITLPTGYADTNYVAVPVMEDTSPAQMSANILTSNTFEVYWANAGGGSHNIAWTTFGNL